MPYTVLLYGHDPTLLATREMVLLRHGLRVILAARVAELATLARTRSVMQRVDLLLLCHSIPLDESLAWFTQIDQELPAMKKLRLAFPAQQEYGTAQEMLGAERVFDASRGPAALLRQLDRLLSCDHEGV